SDRVLAAGRSEAEHPALAAYRALAAELGRWLSIGSLWIREGDEPRIRNRQFLIRPDGTIAARYDKIHMFDVDLANGE
ncbi:nitrilase-related carbon-nitrogen hydrolase, partial [Acinetobacter baumannii]